MRRVLGWTLVALVALILAAGVWVRAAPSDPAHWHTDPAAGTAGMNSHVATASVSLPPAQALAAFDAVALAHPRTTRLSGAPEEGRITYISRSALWGFPDYTTVAAVPDGTATTLVIHARARFGRSDLGVNAARVGGWLAALGVR